MEDFYKLSDLVETAGKKISEKTGVEISVEISKDPITPIVNDKFMVQKAAEVGKDVFGDEFYIMNKLYLAGDNACLYFKKVPGIFMVFRSAVHNGQALHNPHFILNEDGFFKALEMLHKYLIKINE